MSSVKSVIISCAGVGSRLGLATTKALIDLGGMTLIARQLKMLDSIEDIRVVVGYQAYDIIEEVKKIRPDAVFCYNHDYFNNKTGASFFLGARHGNEYSIELDGDLLVHPDDMEYLLGLEGEWIAYSDVTSEDTVYVKTSSNGDVMSFSREEGDYEWTGPACIKRDKIKYSSANVFNLLEPYLPMRGVKVRAYDIDTYDDYLRAQDIIKDW